MPRSTRATVVPPLHVRLDAELAHEPQGVLVVDALAVRRVGVEVVGNPAVSLGRVFLMDLLDFFCKAFVLLLALAFHAALPVVIGRPRDMRLFADVLDRIRPVRLGQCFCCFVLAELARCTKASLLSSSFTFFRKSFSSWSQ